MWITEIWQDGGMTVYESILTKEKPSEKEIHAFFDKYYPNGEGITHDKVYSLDEIKPYQSINKAISYNVMDWNGSRWILKEE